jgi:hypothetical protein
MKSSEILFRERLTPRAYVYVVVEALIAMISLAYGVPLGAWVGWFVFVGLSVLAVWALRATSPTIEVTATHLRAGSALIEREFVTLTTALGREEFRLARGRDADPRRFSLLRSWHSGTGALITIDDSRDPHPAWIVTCARPVELAAALA